VDLLELVLKTFRTSIDLFHLVQILWCFWESPVISFFVSCGPLYPCNPVSLTFT
jgi:hypothetical protein